MLQRQPASRQPNKEELERASSDAPQVFIDPKDIHFFPESACVVEKSEHAVIIFTQTKGMIAADPWRSPEDDFFARVTCDS